MKPLSMDLRQRILAAVLEENENMKRIAKCFSVSYKVVQKLKYQWRDLGPLEPQTHKAGRKPSLFSVQREGLDTLIRDDPSLTLEQLRSKLRVDCSLTTIWKELRRLGHTHKKSIHASEQLRSDVQEKRTNWKRSQGRLDISKGAFSPAILARPQSDRTGLLEGQGFLATCCSQD